jgi:hypothetical protein
VTVRAAPRKVSVAILQHSTKVPGGTGGSFATLTPIATLVP